MGKHNSSIFLGDKRQQRELRAEAVLQMMDSEEHADGQGKGSLLHECGCCRISQTTCMDFIPVIFLLI
jgi:hypothetical protein